MSVPDVEFGDGVNSSHSLLCRT